MSVTVPDPSGGPHRQSHATVVLIDPATGAPVAPLANAGAKVTATPDLGTGGTGIIGWLSQLGDYLLSLIGRFPVSLGTKTASASLSVTPASDAQFTIAPGAALAQVTVTRPANTTAYAAGDVVGGVITFPAMGVAGSQAMLTSVDLRIDIAAIPSGMASFRLYLYRVTPPSALADNAAWDLPSGDRAAFVSYIDLGSPLDLGSTLFVQMDGLNKHVKLGAGETALYGYLVTIGAFTPAANSEVYVPTLRAVAL